MQAITVSRLNTYIKQIFDAEELLHNIPVEGEVFGVTMSRNVIYFSLKDEEATLSCVCFYPKFIDDIKEGEKVIVTGSPNYYIKGGKLNFNVVKVERFGQGKLFEEFLKLKQQLENEGLFDKSHKKEIPKIIKRIGVITSREGAVIEDIKNVAWRRNPGVDIVLYNTKVQGIGAEKEIAHAIDIMGNYEDVDVLVVARGGGSLEDLWAYNTEIVARATFNCPKPIVSAVGHETDFTIIDFVSDLRAPTPSAAAELLTFNVQDKKNELNDLVNYFIKAGQNFINVLESKISNFQYFLMNDFDKYLLSQDIKIKRTKDRLIKFYEDYVNQNYYEIGLIENSIKKLNPIDMLARGYAKIEQNNKTIKKVVDLENGEFSVILKDGVISASPIEIKEFKNGK